MMQAFEFTDSVLKKSHPRRSSISFIVLLLCFFLAHDQASSQTPSNDWTNVLRSLQDRRDSLSDVRAEYLVEYMQSPELDQEYDRVSTEAFELAKLNGDIPSEAIKPLEIYNRVATVRFQRQGHLWREDVSEAYPGSIEGELLNHFHGFDGQQYYAYNAEQSTGCIAAIQEDTYPAVAHFGNVSKGSRFIVLSETMRELEAFQDSKLTFSVAGQEIINGEECVKYTATSHPQENFYSRYTVWVSPEKRNSLVKWKSEVFGPSPNRATWWATVRVGNVFAFEKISNGFYVNKHYQEDTFSTKFDEKLHWDFSKRFTMSDIQIPEKTAHSVFLAQFPPGTRLSDDIRSPGHLTVVGVDPGPAAKNMREGVKPKPEPLENSPSPRPQTDEVFQKPKAPEN